MSTKTPKLGLLKPELSDAADVTAYNENWDKIDTLTPEDIGALPIEGGVLTGQGFYINNKSGRFVGNQNGIWIRTASSDVDNNEDARHIKLWNATYVSELKRAFCLFDAKTGKDYVIYGEHNFPDVAKIATGSYVGTGKYGSGNKNTLSFDFEPKMVIVFKSHYFSSATENSASSFGRWSDSYQVFLSGANTFTVSMSNSYDTYYTISNKTLTWYNKSGIAGHQMNVLNETYHYIAIG